MSSFEGPEKNGTPSALPAAEEQFAKKRKSTKLKRQKRER